MKSRTSGKGRGVRVQFQAVTGITLPGMRLIALEHRDYKEAGIDGRNSYKRIYPFSTAMAQRLVEFARICLFPEGKGYDGRSFLYYMIGAVNSPTSERVPSLRGDIVSSSRVTLGLPYFIADASRVPIHPFVGLAPGVALNVGGRDGMLYIAMLDRLVRAYGGTHILQITHIE